jgi:short subunit dehydrogenase-like uncharacterized protein
MNTHNAWLIYGATGDTGKLIVEEAVRRGHKPVLAGRSEDKLRAMAEPLGLEWIAFDLDDPQALHKAALNTSLILNVAGPFSNTSALIVRACLEASVSYLDVANEVEVFEALYAQDETARHHGVALIPGVGFGVTTSDCLAMHVANQVPGAQELEVAISLYNAHESPSAMLTRTRAMAGGGRVRRAGRLEHVVLGAGGRRVPFPDGTHTILPVPLADVVSSYRSTGIPNVTAYMTFAVNPFIARMALPIVQKLAAIPAIQQMLARPNRSPTEPEMQAVPQHSYIWARANDGKGRAAEAWLETGEGYGYSAAAAVRAVEQVLQHQPVGALTPAQAFGPDFPLAIPGVRRFTSTGR